MNTRIAKKLVSDLPLNINDIVEACLLSLQEYSVFEGCSAVKILFFPYSTRRIHRMR